MPRTSNKRRPTLSVPIPELSLHITPPSSAVTTPSTPQSPLELPSTPTLRTPQMGSPPTPVTPPTPRRSPNPPRKRPRLARRLFPPPLELGESLADSCEDLQLMLRQEQDRVLAQFRERWNWDLLEERPLPGVWEWQEVVVATE